MASANGRVLGIEAARRATRSRREYWRALIEECRRSGLSQAAFCRRRGIPPGTLGYWKCILVREGYATGLVIEVGCWAHARRYFWEAKATDAPRALTALS